MDRVAPNTLYKRVGKLMNMGQIQTSKDQLRGTCFSCLVDGLGSRHCEINKDMHRSSPQIREKSETDKNHIGGGGSSVALVWLL